MEQPADADNINAGCRTEPSASDFVCSLETINDDCLREILQYLNIMDIVNLSRASERLLQFSKNFIFPIAVKECIVTEYENGLTSLSYNRRSIEIEMPSESFETAFRYFGAFVEDLEMYNVSTENLLANCHILKKLYFNTDSFNSNRTHELQNLIERLQYLKELQLDSLLEFPNEWRASNGISNVIKLTILAMGVVNSNFIDYFKNLTSLSIEIGYGWRNDDFEKMLDNSRHSLKHLKVTDEHNQISPGTVARLINKLHKLESLELNFKLTDKTTCFIQLPHLKSVAISCEKDYNLNSVLRTLSDNGIIEELSIKGGELHERVVYAQPPLSFPKLRKIAWHAPEKSGILKTLTISQMPEIQSIEIKFIAINELDGLVRIIKSKNTLKTMKLYFSNHLVPLSFWRQIIDVLKEFPTPRRPFLSVVLRRIVEEGVIELVKANRKIIKLEYLIC